MDEKKLRNDAIVAAYECGLSLAAVGREFGLSAERVRAILRAQGVPRRSRGRVYGRAGPTPSRSTR